MWRSLPLVRLVETSRRPPDRLFQDRLEYAGETLSCYEVEYVPGSARAAGKLKEVRCLELFETAHSLAQPRLFGLEEALGADGWLKALKLDEYAPRRSGQAQAPQQVLFPYASALP